MRPYQRLFSLRLYHGHGNDQQTTAEIAASSAGDAAKAFMLKHFPGERVYTPGRYEGPRVMSFGVSNSGQRLYVYEV